MAERRRGRRVEWGEERGGAAHEASLDATPKQRKLIEMQRAAGNGATARWAVQRMFGDWDEWGSFLDLGKGGGGGSKFDGGGDKTWDDGGGSKFDGGGDKTWDDGGGGSKFDGGGTDQKGAEEDWLW